MPLFEAFVEIGASLAPLKAGLAKARAAVNRSTANLGRMAFKGLSKSIASGMRRILTGIKRTMKLMTVAVVAATGIAVKAFASFQAQIANVSTMLTKQTMHLIPTYATAILDMAKQFGASTKTLAEALYNILSASIAPEKAMKTLAVVSKAATAGLTEVGTAAYAITGILNAYGLSADKAGEVSDILFAAVKMGQTTFDQLSSSVGRATAIAASAGVSFEEVAAALATITRGGISTDEAVTSLRMAIIALQGNTEGAVKLAKQHGVTLSYEALQTKGLIGM